MRRGTIPLVIAVALAGCGGSHPKARACVPAPIHNGAPPSWTAAAFSDSSPGFTIPYALSDKNAAAAFFFAPVLRAGHPVNPSNKVLWVVRSLRNGHPLQITAHSGARTVRMSFPDNAEPGEIYPSYVDLPTSGCWSLALRWGPHSTHIDVNVVRGRP
ncbi:MAG TPA: hypothetical protein VKT31_10185 [Solirubrobacteraceae bacterium]|nr:hypothetical protein [Solirubrobacteraceae bacterium]